MAEITKPPDDWRRAVREPDRSSATTIFPRDTSQANVIQLPSPLVGIEPGRWHGWNIVARRLGVRLYHRHSVALLSVAHAEADELAADRGWLRA